MKNVLLLPVLLLVSLSAKAELCSEITNDAQRLTCFDRQSRCAVVEDAHERLVCFDNRAHQATAEQLPEEIQSTTQHRSPPEPPEVASSEPPTPAAPVSPAAPPAPVVEVDSQTAPPVPTVAVETQIEPEIETDTEPARTSANETKTVTAEELEEAFPVRDAPRAKEDKPAPIELKASISDVYRDGRSLAIITLDNGQVWREIRKSRFNYRTGLDVTISVGVMGSNNLKADGMKKFVKVKRLK